MFLIRPTEAYIEVDGVIKIIDPRSSKRTFYNPKWQEREQAIREVIAEVGLKHLKLSDIEKIYSSHPQ